MISHKFHRSIYSSWIQKSSRVFYHSKVLGQNTSCFTCQNIKRQYIARQRFISIRISFDSKLLIKSVIPNLNNFFKLFCHHGQLLSMLVDFFIVFASCTKLKSVIFVKRQQFYPGPVFKPFGLTHKSELVDFSIPINIEWL